MVFSEKDNGYIPIPGSNPKDVKRRKKKRIRNRFNITKSKLPKKDPVQHVDFEPETPPDDSIIEYINGKPVLEDKLGDPGENDLYIRYKLARNQGIDEEEAERIKNLTDDWREY